MTARTSDPQTSHVAAANVTSRLPTLKAAFLSALREIGPATANEIARHATEAGVVANAESVRKRATELVREGLARFGAVKRCSVTGEQARTLELANALELLPAVEVIDTEAERRGSTGDTRQRAESCRASSKVSSVAESGQSNQATGGLSALEEERVAAVVVFCRDERGWVEEWRIASDIIRLQRTNASWPVGTPDEWITAVAVAIARGLIERGENKRVRWVAEKVGVKATQMDLFE